MNKKKMMNAKRALNEYSTNTHNTQYCSKILKWNDIEDYYFFTSLNFISLNSYIHPDGQSLKPTPENQQWQSIPHSNRTSAYIVHDRQWQDFDLAHLLPRYR